MKLTPSFLSLFGAVFLVSCSAPQIQEPVQEQEPKIVKSCPDGRPYYDIYGEDSLEVPELIAPVESTDQGLHYVVGDLDFWLPLTSSEYHVFAGDEGLILSQANDAHCMDYGDAFEPYITRIDSEDSFAVHSDGFSEVKTQAFSHFDATVYTELSFGGTHLDTYEFTLGEHFYRAGAMQEHADTLKAILGTLSLR